MDEFESMEAALATADAALAEILPRPSRSRSPNLRCPRRARPSAAGAVPLGGAEKAA
jgi:hypothetical protein